jgi:dTMP kinase
MLLKGEQNKWSTTEELLMFSAARSKHVREIIQPSLAKGKWVISDRFADSSTVYQGYVQQYDMETINMLHNLAVGTCWPDLTILLDIPVSIGLSRKNDQTQSGLDEIRFESHGSEYHEKIRRSFLKLAEENPKRITIVDATGSIEEVQHRIINAINMALAKRVDMLAS